MDETSISNTKELDKLLKQKTNYNFKDLKNHFDLKEDIDLMDFLSEYFNKKLDNYNFESEVKNNKYLSKVVKYFGYSPGKIDLDEDYTMRLIDNLFNVSKKIIVTTTNNIKEDPTKNSIENSVLLLTIYEEIEKVIDNLKSIIDYDNKIEVISENKLSCLLKDVVFDIKNLPLLEALFNNFPNLSFIKDYDEVFVLEKILDKYYNDLVNSNNYYKKIYYDKVIDIFSLNISLSNENIIEETFYKKMRSFINSTVLKDYNSDKKDYILADITERIKRYEMGNKIDFLDDKDDDYYKNIDFDTIGSLVGVEKVDKRTDMRDRYVITIDNDQAKMFENAISIEESKNNTYLLTIYATDISSFISDNKMKEKDKYKSILETLNKKNLFGKKYKHNHCKLEKGKDVDVIAYQYLVDEGFNILYFDFQRAIVNIKENLKFSDFNNLGRIKNKKTKDTIGNLLDVTYPYININEANNNIADSMLCFINTKTASEIANYTVSKELPVIYNRIYRQDVSEFINYKEETYGIDLSFLRYDKKLNYPSICTIGNDEISDLDKFNFKIYSPLRKIEALINQMLINTYLVDHKKLDNSTKNYLETRLDSICSRLNNKAYSNSNIVSNTEKANIKKKIKALDFDK